MGYFIAYRHTGADPEHLEVLLPSVRDSLEVQGQDAYCTYFDEDQFRARDYSPRDIMEHAFEKIQEMGNLFVVLDSEEKSEGMILEVGFCLARDIGIVVAKRAGVNNTYLPDMSNHTFEYQDASDLKQKILKTEGPIWR